ncbi:MAG: hypothetical protein LBL52_02655, partial [Rickettsiales bacterium]|nr:hypothetical protein [Rickettsiales bacterium]
MLGLMDGDVLAQRGGRRATSKTPAATTAVTDSSAEVASLRAKLVEYEAENRRLRDAASTSSAADQKLVDAAKAACRKIRSKQNLQVALGFSIGGGAVSLIGGGLNLAGQLKNNSDMKTAKGEYDKEQTAQKDQSAKLAGLADGYGKAEADQNLAKWRD